MKKQLIDIPASEVMHSYEALPLISEHVNRTRQKIGYEPDGVLVIGCADGAELEMWKNSFGIDLNEFNLQKCRESGFRVSKMDMHDMSYLDDSFELVSLRDVFEHSVSHIQSLSEIARVSSKYVAITIPGLDWQDSEWHFIIPNLKQMISLGEKCGLLLKHYREFNYILGSTAVTQHYYLFIKE